MKFKQLLLVINFIIIHTFFPRITFGHTTAKLISKIDKVTLFLSDARINCSVNKIGLEKGQTYLVIKEISNKLDINSVKAKIEGKASILSIKGQKNKEDLPKILAAKNAQQLLVDRITRYKNTRDSFKREKGILEANSELLSVVKKGSSFDKVRHSATVFRHRMEEITDTIYTLEKHIKRMGEKYTKADKKIQHLIKTAPSNEIVVLVRAEKDTEIKLLAEYMVAGTQWKPVYHVKTKNTKQPATLEYKASIQNNTGVDWKDVKLQLETVRTLKKRPQLTAQTLIDENEVAKEKQKLLKKAKKKKKHNKSKNDTKSAKDKFPQDSPELLADTDFDGSLLIGQTLTPPQSNTPKTTSPFNQKFVIPKKYTITANGEDYLLDIQKTEIPVQYVYFCIPKLDKTVFLLARVTDWKDIPMLEGNATVFHNEKEIGKSPINQTAITQGIDFMLNVVKDIAITRAENKEKRPSKFLNTSISERIQYKIEVTNNQADTIDIELFDQLPIAKSKTIKVEEVTAETATSNDKKTGKIKWNYTLAPAQSQTFDLAYTLKYSKKSQLAANKNAEKPKQQELLIPSDLADEIE